MLNQLSFTFSLSPDVCLLVQTQTLPSHIRGSTDTVLPSKSADPPDRNTNPPVKLQLGEQQHCNLEILMLMIIKSLATASDMYKLNKRNRCVFKILDNNLYFWYFNHSPGILAAAIHSQLQLQLMFPKHLIGYRCKASAA